MTGRGRPRREGPPQPLFEPRPLDGLRARRLAAGMTQARAAEIADVSNKAHYGKIERGIVRLDIHRAAALARALGCTIEGLI